MKTLKKYSKYIGLFLGLSIIFSLFLSLFNFFGLLNTKISDNLITLFMIVIFLIIGFRYGYTASKNGYIEGLKIGMCLIFFLVFINLIFYQSNFSIERFIYYLVLILSSIFGSMLGINRKK